MAWEEMAWKETVAPSSLQDVILLRIPKRGKLLPGGKCNVVAQTFGFPLSPHIDPNPRFGQFVCMVCSEGSHLPPGAVVEQNALRRIGLQKLLRQLTSRLRDALIASLHSGLHGWINSFISLNDGEQMGGHQWPHLGFTYSWTYWNPTR